MTGWQWIFIITTLRTIFTQNLRGINVFTLSVRRFHEILILDTLLVMKGFVGSKICLKPNWLRFEIDHILNYLVPKTRNFLSIKKDLKRQLFWCCSIMKHSTHYFANWKFWPELHLFIRVLVELKIPLYFGEETFSLQRTLLRSW